MVTSTAVVKCPVVAAGRQRSTNVCRVTAPLARQVGGGGVLGVRGVPGHHHTGQVHTVQQRRNLRDLVGSLSDPHVRDHDRLLMGQRGEQPDLRVLGAWPAGGTNGVLPSFATATNLSGLGASASPAIVVAIAWACSHTPTCSSAASASMSCAIRRALVTGPAVGAVTALTRQRAADVRLG